MKADGENLGRLMGWKKSLIAQNMALGTPAYLK